MQHLARPDERVENLFLSEAATQTIRGVMERLNEASEEIAQFLRRTWEHAAEGALTLAAPAEWREADEPLVDFGGFAPGPTTAGDVMVGNPLLLVRLGLAQRLLDRDRPPNE